MDSGKDNVEKVWQKDKVWLGQLEGTPNIKLNAKNEAEAVLALEELRKLKESGVRTIVDTDLVVLNGDLVVPVKWSLIGECYTGEVYNRSGKLQSFWGKTMEDFQAYMIEASQTEDTVGEPSGGILHDV